MKLAVLLSGGKDSLLAAFIAKSYHEVECCITIESRNPHSYMFHTPNIEMTALQSNAMNNAHISVETLGEKEAELEDLRYAIHQAKERYNIEGVVSGAVGSQYQASRIQQICRELGVLSFNPLWQMNQVELLDTLINYNFKVIISGVFGYPLTRDWLGRELDAKAIDELEVLQKKFQINPAGEGGETESLVIDCPLFFKKIRVLSASPSYDNYAGHYDINEALLEEKALQHSVYEHKWHEYEDPEITIVSTCKDKLHELEFIRPITDLLRLQNKRYHLTHISNPQIKGKKIIIAGTAILDNQFLDYKDNMKILLQSKLPILGICAGMELLLNQGLDDVCEIGVKPISSEDGRIPKEAYFLHQHGVKSTQGWRVVATTEKGVAAVQKENILGLQFHPEVSKKEIIIEFIQN